MSVCKSTKENVRAYGVGDASYQAAGQFEGLERLVDRFYDYMETLPEAQRILRMHPKDLQVSRHKLTCFLSGWLGGPKLYSQHYGSIAIPRAHQHLPVGDAERDAWMLCMQKALAEQPYDEAFKTYLLEQLAVPAGRVRDICRHRNPTITQPGVTPTND